MVEGYTPQQFAESVANSGTVPANIQAGMAFAWGNAMKAWPEEKARILKETGKLPTPEQANELFKKAIAKEDMLGDGEKKIVERYAEKLLQDSVALDTSKPSKDGPHYIQYMDKASDVFAKSELDIDALRKIDPTTIGGKIAGFAALPKVNAIKKEMAKIAADEIGSMEGRTLEDDFKFRLTQNADGKFNNDLTKRRIIKGQEEEEVLLEPKALKNEPGNPMIALIMLFVALLTGGDIGEALKSFGQGTAPAINRPDKSVAFDPQLEQMYSAAERLSKGDDKNKDADVKIVREAAAKMSGQPDAGAEKLNDAQAKALGERAVKDIEKMKILEIKDKKQASPEAKEAAKKAMATDVLKALPAKEQEKEINKDAPKKAAAAEVPSFMAGLGDSALNFIQGLAGNTALSYVVTTVTPVATGVLALGAMGGDAAKAKIEVAKANTAQSGPKL